jgi:hypothetical protein
MSCWCGHGPWHHYGSAYPPGYPPPDYPPPAYWGPGRGSRRRRSDEELERHLAELEDELARLREELGAARRGEGGSG